MPAPDINEQAKLQQLMSVLGGSKDKTKINLGNPSEFIDIQLNGIPYELAIPCVIQMLASVMEYNKLLNQIQKEDETDESSNSAGCEVNL